MILLNKTFNIFFIKKKNNLIKYFIIKIMAIYSDNKNNR